MTSPNADSGGHPWNAWIPFHLVECGECSALVMDDRDARSNHETFHRLIKASPNDSLETE
jgi:hypothetical protein